MSTLIIYYSFTGNAKRLANRLAAELDADLAQVEDAAKAGKLKAFTTGCFKALGGKAWPITPLDVDIAAYERTILIAPIWAGHVPPAVNSIWSLLPTGTALEVKLVSGSGQSNCREQLEAALQARGCRLKGLEDIKAR